ncbi:DMT family transporter [Kutzneria albida]|uniref:Putative transporter ydeK n=1 Tax=Kutzneria albida DSM 43870 TaxID=1449976 RepID=W5W4L9_9PSEU|nr:DMT family transporter [Kutzneria albida]AHH95837.1 putative transporter ydeK [Kutzneria albida DSM 43870]
MRTKDNVTAPSRVTGGLLLGALGVLAFSFSLPATRLAVAGLDPWFVAFGRAVGAGVLATVYLLVTSARRPTAGQLRRLVVVALGVVVGFPLCTSLALTEQTASHGAVVITMLPAVTAVFGVLRGGERPSRAFWLAAGASFVAVLAFVGVSGGFGGGFQLADLWLLVAVLACGLGYAEGGALARDLGGARTICWALVLSLPVSLAITVVVVVGHGFAGATGSSWLGFAYVTVISMFLGFFAWYAGLARGGVARIGQVQALQPVLTLTWSALLLHEQVSLVTVLVALVVLGCVVLTQRAR